MWDDNWKGIYCACATWKAVSQQAQRRLQGADTYSSICWEGNVILSATPKGSYWLGTAHPCLIHPTCGMKCDGATQSWLRVNQVWHFIACFLPVWASMASVCASRRSFKIAKVDMNVVLWPDSLTYLSTCGIVIQILAADIELLQWKLGSLVHCA